MGQEPHEILGIQANADERAVRRAYRSLLFDLEDMGQSDPAYPEKKRQLQTAFEACLAKAPKPAAEAAVPATADSGSVQTKLAVRVIVGVVAIGLLFAAFQMFKDRTVDPDGEAPVDTAGMIAAIKIEKDGGKAVVIDKDRKETVNPGAKRGATDHDAVWRPDGNRLLFISNRDEENFDIYRWDTKLGKTERRSKGTRAKSNLWFGFDASKQNKDTALFAAGGFVFAYDQQTQLVKQLLPVPRGMVETTGEEGSGISGQLELYKDIGEAFVTAKWGGPRDVVWTVMKRESDKVFVLNPLTSQIVKGIPRALFAGHAVEFDVGSMGEALAIVRSFLFVDPANVPEEFLKDGKPVAPFDSALYLCPPDGSDPGIMAFTKGSDFYFGLPGAQNRVVFTLKGETLQLAQPSVSKDGTQIVFVVGRKVGDRAFQGLFLAALPLKDGSKLQGPAQPGQGLVSSPSFSPDGTQVLYLKQDEQGNRRICVNSLDGRSETVVSPQGGDYEDPSFSPQLPGSVPASK